MDDQNLCTIFGTLKPGFQNLYGRYQAGVGFGLGFYDGFVAALSTKVYLHVAVAKRGAMSAIGYSPPARPKVHP